LIADLIAQLEDANAVVRQDAAVALGDLGHQAAEAMSVLRHRLLLASLSYHDRTCAAWALSQIVEPGDEGQIADLLHVIRAETSPYAGKLRYYCALALEKLCADEKLQTVKELLRSDADQSCRIWAGEVNDEVNYVANYGATITWRRNGVAFSDKRYSRAHTWKFDGGAEVVASSSPHIVPLPFSDPAGVDPEEAFVASLSSCHMLWFLSIACKRGYVVESYEDAADGLMEKNAEGKLAMTLVRLRPKVAFAGSNVPDEEAFQAMHHDAHVECFIANSVKSEIVCEPSIADAVS